jgi:hypothetical protein
MTKKEVVAQMPAYIVGIDRSLMHTKNLQSLLFWKQTLSKKPGYSPALKRVSLFL